MLNAKTWNLNITSRANTGEVKAISSVQVDSLLMNPIIIGVTSTSRYVHWHTGSPLHWHWQCPFTGKLQSQVVPMLASMHARACQWALPPCPMLPCLAEVPFLCSVIPSKLNEPQAPSQAARPDQPALLKSRSPPVPVGLVRMELHRPVESQHRAFGQWPRRAVGLRP
jgi:hypothetical protein